jgi:hypothetical protein
MPMLDVHGEDVVNGGTLPVYIWSADMAEVTTQDPVLDFPRPDRREFVPLSRGYAVNPADSSPSVTTFVSSAAEVADGTDTSRDPPAVI